MDVDYNNTGNIDLLSFKQKPEELPLDMPEFSDDGAAILPGTDRKTRPSKREPLRRMNSGGRLRNVRKAWGDFKSKMKIPKKGTKHANSWNVPQGSPENLAPIMRTPKSVTKQRLLDIAYSPDIFKTPEHCRVYREANSATPGTAQGEFLRRSIRIANRTPTPSNSSQKSRKRNVKPRRIETNSSKDVYQDVNNLVQMTRTMTTVSSAVDCFKGIANGFEESIEKNESEVAGIHGGTVEIDSKKANGSKTKQKTPHGGTVDMDTKKANGSKKKPKTPQAK